MNGIITKEKIKGMIYEVRGKKVMLASDLAKLFDMETKNINKAVRRNIDNFQNEMYFQLTKNECGEISSRWQNTSLRFHFGTLKNNENGRGNHIKYLPYVFTSEGISILETIIKSEKVREILGLILDVFKVEDEYRIIPKTLDLKEESIRNMIYEIDGKQVMLDEDLAVLYNCKNGTKEINQAVKNNIDKFPERYSWVLSDHEYLNLRSKFLTSSWENYGGRRYNPRVFTEEGIVMLATILKTQVAVQVTIAIIDTFVIMRKYISNNLLEHDNSIKLLQNSFSKFEEKKVLNEIYFNGQIYDAYSKIVDLMREAKEELIVIDGYADKSVLDMISKLKVNVTLIVKSKSLLNKLDLERYNKQYNNLKVIYDDTFHDRYLILDKEKVYHLGASINQVESKTFSINTIGDESIIKLLANRVKMVSN